MVIGSSASWFPTLWSMAPVQVVKGPVPERRKYTMEVKSFHIGHTFGYYFILSLVCVASTLNREMAKFSTTKYTVIKELVKFFIFASLKSLIENPFIHSSVTQRRL
jgi:hypothetical protein